MTEKELCDEAKILLAAKLYELGRVSAGVAAQVAGMDRLSFLNVLSKYGVPTINLKEDEVDHEIEAARKLSGR